MAGGKGKTPGPSGIHQELHGYVQRVGKGRRDTIIVSLVIVPFNLESSERDFCDFLIF